MQTTIRNFVGLKEADLQLDPGSVHIVSGRNASGKTSLAVALGGALSLNSNPLGAAATRKSAYLHDESDAGHVVLRTDGEGTETVNWNLQSGDMMRDDENIVPCSSVAAGLVDFTARGFSEKARQELYESLFLPPAETLIQEATRELQGRVTEDTLKGVLEAITRRGWEGVESVYSDRAREAKSDFMKIAGRNYGAKVAADWRPDGWREKYDGMTVADAQAALTEAEDGMRALHVQSAITQAEKEQAEQEAEQLETLKAQLEEEKSKVDDAQGAFKEQNKLVNRIISEGQVAKAEYDRHNLNRPQAQSPLQCPNCKVALIMGDDGLAQHNADAAREAEREWAAKGKELKSALEILKGKNQAAKKQLELVVEEMQQAQSEYSVVQAAFQRAYEAAEKAKQEVSDTDLSGASNAAEQARADAEEALRLIEARERAQQAHQNVQQYSFIARILGSKGVRAKAMDSAVVLINKVLARISKDTRWPAVKVESGTYAVTIAGRRVLQMCSESERWRAQTALQIAIARIKRDPVIVLDRFDLLDWNGRDKCLNLIDEMVHRKDPPAVVICGTEIVEKESPLPESVRAYQVLAGYLTPMRGEAA